MTEHKWLGVDAIDGARIGPFELLVFAGASDSNATVMLTNEGEPIPRACPLSEVDARTRAWIRSLSSLLMPGFGVCPACERDFNTPDHDPFCSSCVEAGWAEAYRRGHAAGLGAGAGESVFGNRLHAWLERERLRRSKQEGSG